jgi:hypothetical protein
MGYYTAKIKVFQAKILRTIVDAPYHASQQCGCTKKCKNTSFVRTNSKMY